MHFVQNGTHAMVDELFNRRMGVDIRSLLQSCELIALRILVRISRSCYVHSVREVVCVGKECD